jgi:hypothetical protein
MENQGKEPVSISEDTEIGHQIVLVTVDRKEQKVRSDTYHVAEFKKLVGVSEELALDQLIDSQFVTLDDESKIDIKGGEVFVSHVRTGSSS